MCDIACLLGYLNHDGVKSELFLQCTSVILKFPPYSTSLKRIIERSQATGRDVVTVTSTLYTYFRSQIPTTIKDENIFEYALRSINLMIHIKHIPKSLPIDMIKTEDFQFLKALNQPETVFFWRENEKDLKYVNLDIKLKAIEDSYKGFASFTPIAPLSVNQVIGSRIIRGKEHSYLYLTKSQSKDMSLQSCVDIIDPMKGRTFTVDLETWSKEQGKEVEENVNADGIATLIDPDQVKQVIMVCFDNSGSMNQDLNAKNYDMETPTRATIAIQYLTSFANMTYGFHVPCIMGLVTFGHEVNYICPFSPLVPDFENRGLKNIEIGGNTPLWDALSFSCDEIIRFITSPDGRDAFPNAARRILVISDGEDTSSIQNPADVCRKLVENKITVDSIIASTTEENRILCSLSKITGGLAVRPKEISDGLKLFENSAFLNIEERKESNKPLIGSDRKTVPKKIAKKPEIITDEFLDEAASCLILDSIPTNKSSDIVNSCDVIATPLHICSKNQSEESLNRRQRRILRELHFCAEVMDENSDNYDPDVRVYPNANSLDYWEVYLKSSSDTQYKGKWFKMYVDLPELYPVEPPKIRFITVPYHLNVSSEGRICLNLLDKGYISSNHVIEIIQETKQLFLIPEESTAIQIEILDCFKHDRDEYDRLAAESADKKGKDEIDEFLQGIKIENSVAKEFKLDHAFDSCPPYMRSQITGRPIEKSKLVMASSGVYYDREELKQLVASSDHPICVITGKVLTEKLEDFENGKI